MAALTAKGPSCDTPGCCHVPCPARPLGATAQGETSSVQTKASNARCLNHRASTLECLYLRKQGFDSSDRFICIDPSCCSYLAPESQQRLPNTRDGSTGQKLVPQLSHYKVHCVSSKTWKNRFLLQPVNSSPETLAHVSSSSKAVISSQQVSQTSDTAVF